MTIAQDPHVVVIGLGYVGLPLAVALADRFKTTGFDIDRSRIDQLRGGHDRTREIDVERMKASPLLLTSRADDEHSRLFSCAVALLYAHWQACGQSAVTPARHHGKNP